MPNPILENIETRYLREYLAQLPVGPNNQVVGTDLTAIPGIFNNSQAEAIVADLTAQAIGPAITASYASQTQAEVGVVNNKGMTPYLTRKAIDARIKTPEYFGADPYGNDPSEEAFAEAKAYGATLVLYPDTIYKVANNASTGVINSQGGKINVDGVGKKLIFDDVIGDPALTVFTGTGIAQSSQRKYSVGWYDGAFVNRKFDFMKRAFETNRKQECYLPIPHRDDVASNGSSWLQDGEILIDDPENQTTYIWPSRIVATVPMSAQIRFSPFNKTEDILFPYGIDLDGAGLAERNIKFHGGARIKFGGKTALNAASKISFDLSPDLFTTDEIQVEMLYPVNFGERGLDINGVGPFFILNTYIDKILHNLGTASASNLYRITGAVYGAFIGPAYDNHDSEVPSLTQSVGLIDSTDTFVAGAYRNPQGVVFEALHEFNNNIPLLKSQKSFLANDGLPPSFQINDVFRNSANTTPLLVLDHCQDVVIGKVSAPLSTITYPVTVGPDAKGVAFTSLSPDKVSGVGDFMSFGGREGFTNNLDVDGFIGFGVKTSGGIARAYCGGAGFWAEFTYRSDGVFELIGKGTNTDLVAGDGSGAVAGKITIGVTAGRIYFVNKTTGTRKVNFSF